MSPASPLVADYCALISIQTRTFKVIERDSGIVAAINTGGSVATAVHLALIRLGASEAKVLGEAV